MAQQVRPEQLSAQLARSLAPLYVVHGDEPLVALEAGDAIRTAARAAGITERDVLIAEAGFKWDAFLAANANLGLFGERKLIDLRIPGGKPGVDGAKALERYARDQNPDNVTLITLPRLDRTAQSSAWFAALADAAVVVPVYPVERAELPAWIGARFARQKQKASREALAFLTERCEGNLLAAKQEIEKLALLLPEGDVSLAAVEAVVADVARYDVFELSEAWLAGDGARVVRILGALEAANEPITLTVWQLGEDLHLLGEVHDAVARGQSPSTAVRNVRAWGKRQAALERAARRVTASQLIPLTASLAKLDALAKGLGNGNAWRVLAIVALELAGEPLALA
jgi:DNA polymerase-3 subunit delta